MKEYFIPAGFGEAELTVKRSRFIGRVWHTETGEEAAARIREMRDKHWDATHNVYAYIIHDGGIMRYSDDGEPQGTSGIPTLNVFRGREICDVCCVVTRYFGGTLLGTGGLVRAYSHTAKLALEAAGISAVRLWKRILVSCAYNRLQAIKNEIERHGGATENIDYGADVLIEVWVPENQWDTLQACLTDISAGTAYIEVLGEETRAVRIG